MKKAGPGHFQSLDSSIRCTNEKAMDRREYKKKKGGGGGIAPISNKSPIEMSEQLRELLFLALRGTWPR